MSSVHPQDSLGSSSPTTPRSRRQTSLTRANIYLPDVDHASGVMASSGNAYTTTNSNGSLDDISSHTSKTPIIPPTQASYQIPAQQQAPPPAHSRSHESFSYNGHGHQAPGTSAGRTTNMDSSSHPDPPPKGKGGYNAEDNDVKEGIGCCGYCLTALSYIIIVFTFPFSLCLCLKVVQEYERAVIFRLGRLLPGGAKGPGLFFVIPCTDSYTKVDLRTVSFDVPPQEILSKDSVTVAVDAVVYYRVQNATISITNVEDANRSTRLLAQTTLRNVLGTKNLSDILAEREAISQFMQESLDEATDPWGVKVERVEIKDVRLPVQLQRAMAAEAEATREARAKVIAAEGEMKASRALREAADIINESPSALQLRYLQTLNSISAEKNSTIIFPLPIDMLKGFVK